MTTEILQVDGTKMEKVLGGFTFAGFRLTSTNENLTRDELDEILNSLSKRDRKRVMSGTLSIVPREKRTFQNGPDTITGIDFDTQENNRVVVATDPIFIISGPTAQKTANVAREILIDGVLTDVVNSALTSGILSSQFKTSAADYARLAKLSPEDAYQKCVRLLISGSVTSLKSMVEIRPTTVQTKQPVQPTVVR